MVRFGFAFVLLLSACAPVRPVVVLPPVAPPSAPEELFTYSPPDQFADFLSANVVAIDVPAVPGCSEGNIGYGLIVNSDIQSGIAHIATAKHIVASHSCAQDIPLTVRYCANGDSISATIHSSANDMDLAIIAGDLPSGFQPAAEVVARTIDPDDQVWLIGFDNTCDVRPQGVFLRNAIAETALISEPLAGGSSGGTIFSERGVVGLVLKQSGGSNRTAILRMSAIRDFVQQNSLPAANLEYSNNLPPQSRQAARETYRRIIGDYTFNAEQIRDFFDKGWHSANNLRQIVPMYNEAFTSLEARRELLTPYVARYWPDQGDAVRSVLELADQTHAAVRELNHDVNSIGSNGEPTPLLNDRLNVLRTSVADLSEAHTRLLEQINE